MYKTLLENLGKAKILIGCLGSKQHLSGLTKVEKFLLLKNTMEVYNDLNTTISNIQKEINSDLLN